MKQNKTKSSQKDFCSKHYLAAMSTVVKTLRTTAEYSLKECQDITGINFSDIERRKRIPSSRNICKLCRFLKIKPWQFHFLAEKFVEKECSFFPLKNDLHDKVMRNYDKIQKLVSSNTNQ